MGNAYSTSTNKTRVGIVNVTGYAGVELARLLSHHPNVEITSISGRSAAGKKLGDVFPHLAHLDLTITAELGAVDFAFSALPHKESSLVVSALLKDGIKVVDISADFRLKEASLYQEWYNFNHPAPELLSEAVYGLPEIYRDNIAKAHLVANPGCYSTSTILGLAPLLKSGVIGSHVIIDSKSGVSGAGRTLNMGTHYCEVNEDINAYALEGHRHLPEIEQELAYLMRGVRPVVTFVPHLVPMTRGILTTIYAPLSGHTENSKTGDANIKALFKDFYKDEPFVRVVDAPPHSKHTWGSNMCLVYPTVDIRTKRIIVISTIDNLVKGAAGQAIQNMNIMLGMSETAGLDNAAIYP
ncbi:MAG: N-acetyl-gamma-glutamyl-phosphate reductase [Dehalococcoidia bacterium]|nr:N-acetyl-gamma-glutamyl-phosphate reductase [Dehalococcoidia bacterium]